MPTGITLHASQGEPFPTVPAYGSFLGAANSCPLFSSAPKKEPIAGLQTVGKINGDQLITSQEKRRKLVVDW